MRTINIPLGAPIGGVSEEPLATRRADAVEDMVNWMPRGDLGLTRRPPTTLVRSDMAGAYLVDFQDEEGDTKLLAIGNGDVRVFDSNAGTEEPVILRDGAVPFLSGANGYRTAQYGNDVYVLNRDADAVALAETREPDLVSSEALIYLRRADFATTYTVKLYDADTLSYVLQQVGGDAAAAERVAALRGALLATTTFTTASAQSPTDRRVLATDEVAQNIAGRLIEALPPSAWDVTPLGSVVYLRRKDGRAFTVQATDGLADTGIVVVQSVVRSLTDLPPRATHGFRVKVSGDPATGTDDLWVRFNNTWAENEPGGVVGTEFGAWTEVPAPGSRVSLDADTMPFVLRRAEPLALAEVAAPPLPTVTRVGEESGARVFVSTGSQLTTNFVENESGGPGSALTGFVRFAFLPDPIPGLVGVVTPAEALGWTDGGFFQEPLRVLPVRLRATLDTRALAEGESIQVELYHVYLGVNTAGDAIRPDINVNTTATVGGGLRAAVVEFSFRYVYNFADYRLRFRRRLADGTFGSWTLAPNEWQPATGLGTVEAFVGGATGESIVTLPADAPAGTEYDLTVNEVTLTATSVAEFVSFFSQNPPAGQQVLAGVAPRTLVVRPVPGNAPARVSVASGYNQGLRANLRGTPLLGLNVVGATVRNVTDGSTATVLAHTNGSIQTTAPVGGLTNTFRRGDRLEFRPAGNPWTFGRERWASRACGSEDTVPAPGIVGRRLTDLLVHRGRLVLVAEDTALLSVAGDPLSLWRRNSRVVLADDPVDVRASGWRIPRWHDSHEWNGALVLVGDESVWTLTGTSDGPLTPDSVRLTQLTTLSSTPGVSAVPLAGSLILPRSRQGGTQLRALVAGEGGVQPVPMTTEVPTYLVGTPRALAAHSGLGTVLLATTGGLYVGVMDEAGERPMAWGRWTFAGGGSVTDLLVVRDVLWIVLSDGALLRMNLDTRDPTGAADAPYRDRRLPNGTGGTAFVSTITFSPFVPRDRDGRADLRTRLTLRYAAVQQFTAVPMQRTVVREGRPSEVTTSSDLYQRLPLSGDARHVRLTLSTTTDQACRLTAVEYEATAFPRTRR